MFKILEDRTEDSRLPLLSHFTMGLSFIRSSNILTYGTSMFLAYSGIKLLISGLEGILFSLIPVGLSCTGGTFVVLYTPNCDVFFFAERGEGFALVWPLGVAPCGEMLGLLLLVSTCSETDMGMIWGTGCGFKHDCPGPVVFPHLGLIPVKTRSAVDSGRR